MDKNRQKINRFTEGDVAIVVDAKILESFLQDGDLVRIKASNLHALRGECVYVEDSKGIWGCDKEFTARAFKRIGFQKHSRYPNPQTWSQ